MSRLRKTGLTIDDPLSTGTADERPAAPERSGECLAGSMPRSNSEPSREQQPTSKGTMGSAPAPAALAGTKRTRAATPPPEQGPWRLWAGQTRVASYRLPDELLAELASTAAQLGLPIGLLVTAAVAHLLDEPPDVIAALVDRADDARIQGRRAARRGLLISPGSDEASDNPDTL